VGAWAGLLPRLFWVDVRKLEIKVPKVIEIYGKKSVLSLSRATPTKSTHRLDSSYKRKKFD